MILSISNTSPGTTYAVFCDAFDICASAEESAFASEHSKDGVWVLIETAERGDSVLNHVAAERVQHLGAVELHQVRGSAESIKMLPRRIRCVCTLMIPI